MYGNNQVFLKEHNRGLYTGFLYWNVAGFPMYMLRVLASILFTSISYDMLLANSKISKENFAYFCWVNIILNLVGTMMCEVFIFLSPSIRDVYLTLPGVIALNFFFSGIPIKADTLPRWMAPWTPSLSIIRWATQVLNTAPHRVI